MLDVSHAGATEEIRCAASHVVFKLAARGDIEADEQEIT